MRDPLSRLEKALRFDCESTEKGRSGFLMLEKAA